MGSEGPPAVTIHVTGFKKFHGVAENPTETIVGNLKEFMNKRGLPKGLILGSCSILDTAGKGGRVPLYRTLQSAMSHKDSESSNSGRVIWKSPQLGTPLVSLFVDPLTQGQAFKLGYFRSLDHDLTTAGTGSKLPYVRIQIDKRSIIPSPISTPNKTRNKLKERETKRTLLRNVMQVHFGVNSGATRFAIEHQAVNEATFRCPDEMGWKPQKVPIIPEDGTISEIRKVEWFSWFCFVILSYSSVLCCIPFL
ncbi:unnamed protein product [Ilex paraguariensis]|uniref:Uncharacterized protein n=1 Tax=Ilex paraguariensis TaxID=185542 RepID=A0ABC8UJF8_9AQUA